MFSFPGFYVDLPVSMIIDEEEKDTIISTFIRLSIQKESVTIIRGMD